MLNISRLSVHFNHLRIVCTCQAPQSDLHMPNTAALHRTQPIHTGLLSTQRVCGQDLCLLFVLVLALAQDKSSIYISTFAHDAQSKARHSLNNRDVLG